MENHPAEIKVIIADLQKYLSKLDEYGNKPLHELDYYDIHRYNVIEDEYIRRDTLMEKLCPSDREELENCFLSISRCSHPFSSLHVAANDHRPPDQQDLTQLVEWLRKEICKTIQVLTGPSKQASPQEEFILLPGRDDLLDWYYKRHPMPACVTHYRKRSPKTTRKYASELRDAGLIERVGGEKDGDRITRKGQLYYKRHLA